MQICLIVNLSDFHSTKNESLQVALSVNAKFLSSRKHFFYFSLKGLSGFCEKEGLLNASPKDRFYCYAI